MRKSGFYGSGHDVSLLRVLQWKRAAAACAGAALSLKPYLKNSRLERVNVPTLFSLVCEVYAKQGLDKEISLCFRERFFIVQIAKGLQRWRKKPLSLRIRGWRR